MKVYACHCNKIFQIKIPLAGIPAKDHNVCNSNKNSFNNKNVLLIKMLTKTVNSFNNNLLTKTVNSFNNNLLASTFGHNQISLKQAVYRTNDDMNL